jgi:hypothetical protein
MHAAIAYKWRTYAKWRYQWRVLQFLCYSCTYLVPLAYLARSDPADEATKSMCWGMLALLYVAQAIGLTYTMQEFLQLNMLGPWVYLSDFSNLNLMDMAQLSIQYVLTIAYTWREITGSRTLESVLDTSGEFV